MRKTGLWIWGMTLCLLTALPAHADVSDELWQQLKKGDVFVLIRHALAPGTGDPANFTLGECSTQRNLNSEGRFQSEKMGQLFKEKGLGSIPLYTSQWCRCVETAELMALGEVIELPAINSFFRNLMRRDVQTEMTKDWLLDRSGASPSVLVTHQVNITALTDIFPSSGELIFARFKEGRSVEVVGRLQTR